MNAIVSLLGPDWIVTMLLLSARIAALLLMTPLLYAASMPLLVRVLVTLGFSCVIALPFAGSPATVPQEPGPLLQALLREVTVGATLGLGVLMAFAGFGLAGRLVDVQVGFGIAQVFDPLTRSRMPVLSSIFALFAAVFFFLVNGHHALLRGIAYSVERFPVGQSPSLAGAAEAIAREAAALFTLGFALAAPIVLGLLLVDFALGVIARNLPQLNMLVLGVPVKIVAGLLALWAWAGAFGAPAGRLYAGIYRTWTAWLAAGAR
ncbi:type III secretion system export apparatus subunit SctT [Ramlibacter monticola]|uniref:Flagellar biosynthetic protein FliR n=1 Tax=Ramlibacter monticola TaxID=1926872 RepID=A0A936Z209_9BURK|nr:flagellar biosynthetic protein FliR [Ramlibacter monticola]MBL0393518.1 flagellar biosynthetic protein FliR [Ramlibacter monticola]